MRIIARSTLLAYATDHPEIQGDLNRWFALARRANWKTTAEVLGTFPRAKTLNAERIRFPIHGGDYRLIVAFDFQRQAAFIKFLGTHAEYDRVDALTVEQF